MSIGSGLAIAVTWAVTVVANTTVFTLPAPLHECEHITLDANEETKVTGFGIDIVIKPGESLSLQSREGKWERRNSLCDTPTT